MALFGFNSRQYEVHVSLVLVVYATLYTHHKFRCVGNFDRYAPTLIIYVPAEVLPACPASEFAALHSRAPLQAQSVIQFWLDPESSCKRLSQLALNLMASLASQAYVERLFSLWWSDSKKTEQY